MPEEFFDTFPADLKLIAKAMLPHKVRQQRFNFDQKFEILDKFLDYFTEVQFDDKEI